MNDKKKSLLITICVSVLMLVSLVLSAVAKKAEENDKTGTFRFDDNWNYLISIKIKNSNSVSTYYDNNKNNVYILAATHNITDDMRGKTLSFKTNNAYVDVYISESISASDENTGIFSKDNSFNLTERVYHFGKKPHFGDSPGSCMHFIDIPDDAKGSITIRIETSYKNSFLKNYNFYLGSEKEILSKYLSIEKYSIISGGLLFCFGIILLVYFIINKTKKTADKKTYYLGLLSIVLTVYSACPLLFTQYIIKTPIGHYYLKYLTGFILPFLILGYVGTIVKIINFRIERYVLVAMIIVLSLLHFTQIAAYTRTISIYFAGLVILVIVIMIRIARMIKKLNESEENEEAEILDDLEESEETNVLE
ncbi:MAG: hypothetical protein IJ054_00875 [Lachnospiraceae bacterium]|nr:hypothetical protein [Lachnospiraceae bacterium]MBQ9233576.1 hypothetical protein [Lachnospiraceae bacterium]